MDRALIVVEGVLPTTKDHTNLRLDAMSFALDQRAFGPRRILVAVRVAISERERVAARLVQLGTRVVPSAGNFLLLHAGANARDRFDRLLRLGIIVRPVGNYLLPEHLRVTLGTVEQNDRFLRAWESC